LQSIERGSTIAICSHVLTLRPRRVTPPLQKERGVWVFRTGEPLTAAESRETLRGIREQRARRHAGDQK
jgi:hypothetical protein